MKVTREVIERCNVHFISIEELIYIHTIFLGESWDIKISPNSVSKLVRMGILKDSNSITPFGENVLASCSVEVTTKVTEQSSSDFEEFWALYPQHDGFDKFLKSRLLRLNKPQTKVEWNNVIGSGITHTSLLKALKAEIKFRSQPSPTNNFKYMKNSVNYLKTQAYMDYMDFEDESRDHEHGKEVI